MKIKSTKEIELEFKDAVDNSQRKNELFKMYEADQRKSVQALISKIKRQDARLEDEKKRVDNMCFFENKYNMFSMICGIDEAGRGPLAGPVVAGAVILPKDCRIMYINDSKKLSAKKRDELYDEIREKALEVGVGVVDNKRIDEINILQATYEAMREAIGELKTEPDIFLNDAVKIPGILTKQVPIIKGDAKSQSIAAASIIAKVTRDRIMEAFDILYPEYGFSKHKGYGSAAHIDAIKKYGPCPIHRKTFIKSFVNI